jgi:hypothetical protein
VCVKEAGQTALEPDFLHQLKIYPLVSREGSGLELVPTAGAGVIVFEPGQEASPVECVVAGQLEAGATSLSAYGAFLKC